MTYRLKILPRAEADVQHIFNWLQERSPPGADAWCAAFEAAVERLPNSPQSHSLAHENDFVDFEVRNFLFKTRRGKKYRGVFTIVDDEIRILRVRGPGQRDLNPDEIDIGNQ